MNDRLMEKAEGVEGFVLTPAHLMLISILTDKIITLTATLKTVSGMNVEQVRARIKEEEELTTRLLAQV